jgi:hypothetical protein
VIGYSADDRQQRCYNQAAQAAAAVDALWRKQGCRKKYLMFVAETQFHVAQALHTNNLAGRMGGAEFRFLDRRGKLQTLFLIATSFPFLKLAVDLTSVNGNIRGADGIGFYLEFQTPDWGDKKIGELRTRLRNENYQPKPHHPLTAQMGNKLRKLMIPTLLDRVVERAIVLVLSAVFEIKFSNRSFGFRRGVSLVDAFRTMEHDLTTSGRRVLGKIDLKDAFDRVPHGQLLDILKLYVRDRKLLCLIEKFVRRPSWRNKQEKGHIGLPQGGPLSPTLFNVYLNHVLDRVLSKRYPAVIFLRFADDIILLCQDQAQLECHRTMISKMLTGAGLPVNREKTYGADGMCDLSKGEAIEYLGLKVSWKDDGLQLDLPPEAMEGLWWQLRLHILGQYTNVTWSGRRRYYNKLAEYTIAAWLQAYGGAISEDLWPEIRRCIKAFFQQADVWADRPVDTPATSTLDTLYYRAREGWRKRWHRRMPEPIDRLNPSYLTLRDAHKPDEFRRLEPDNLADGLDFFPAPVAQIKPNGDRKTDADDVDFRVDFGPWDHGV